MGLCGCGGLIFFLKFFSSFSRIFFFVVVARNPLLRPFKIMRYGVVKIQPGAGRNPNFEGEGVGWVLCRENPRKNSGVVIET